MHNFYCPDILSSLELSEEESAHAVRVLRLSAGDTIRIFDGNGHIYMAIIEHAHAKHTKIRITETVFVPKNRNYRIHIAIAPTKNADRLEWFVEKACEIGVDRITPLICRYSERKNSKTERLQKIIIAAIKQSQQAYLPLLDEATPFDKLMGMLDNEQRFIAHCYDDQTKIELADMCEENKDVVIAIGPEGDFSEEEVNIAIRNNFKAVALGKNRLRTETAGVVATHTIHVLNQLKRN
ncbi:MAG: 16S rRNA (uracil(1498)-N(3))-methyltransferase [Paludibacteraceae bacterium]|nr:16S rRNA (uracil(1498)-N(3))-methyltransferase [Paludibacteraceae bacterium]